MIVTLKDGDKQYQVKIPDTVSTPLVIFYTPTKQCFNFKTSVNSYVYVPVAFEVIDEDGYLAFHADGKLYEDSRCDIKSN